MKPEPIIIDAANASLGRLATRIAHLLRGKHTVSYKPHALVPQPVVVKNCSKLKITVRKQQQKLYYRTSGHPGAMKTTMLRDAFADDARNVLLRTVRGMLPNNKQRKNLLLNLHLEN